MEVEGEWGEWRYIYLWHLLLFFFVIVMIDVYEVGLNCN